MSMLDQTKFVKKAGEYAIAVTGGVTDRVLLDVGARYEESLSRNLSSLHPDEIPKRFGGIKELLWSTKYDGEGVLVFYDKDQDYFAFTAPSGRARVGLPALDELAKKLKKAGVGKALLRGELYLPVEKGERRPTIADVVRASFATDETQVAKLRIALFDILMLDGEDMRDDAGSFRKEWDKLEELVGTGAKDQAHRAEGAVIQGKEIEKIFADKVKEGEEGLVIRLLDKADGFKIKPKQTVDCVVMGYVEGEVDGAIGVTSLFGALNYPTKGKDKEIVFQSFARVGSGFGNELRQELLRQLKPLKVDNPIPMTDSDGRPVWFVKPDLIFEMNGEDLIPADSGKKPRRTQAFSWDEKKGTYAYSGLAPCPRLVFPTFSKMREDKDLDAGGARIEQVMEKAKPPAKRAEGPKAPKVVRRTVYRKGDAVRKLVVTERAADDETIPFVIYFTDFSPARKDPLKVTTQYALSKKRRDALADALLEKNIKKGWEEVGVQAPAKAPEKKKPAKPAKAPAKKPAKPAKAAAKKSAKPPAKKSGKPAKTPAKKPAKPADRETCREEVGPATREEVWQARSCQEAG